MMLGKLKIRGWKNWERETLTLDYESTNHPSSFRLTHETSFVRTHTSFWTRIPFFFYVDQLSRNVQIAIHQDTRTAVENGPILLSQARAPCRLCLGLHESRKCTSRNAALTCSAYLRLSTNLTKDDMKGIVEGTIIEMGLHECAVRIIENWHLRGISGLCCTLALYGIS